MMKSEEKFSYSSLPKFDNESHFRDELGPGVWTSVDCNTCLSDPKSLPQDYQYNLSFGPNIHGRCYPCEDLFLSAERNKRPEVYFENVLKRIIAILTGRNRIPAVTYQRDANSNISFLESGKDGDNILHSSVYAPSAPSLRDAEALTCARNKDVLEAEPPEWLPDSQASACMQCSSPFTALTCGRHHCRFCGQIFCRACTKGRCLMPVKFRQREPQRVCDSCYNRLDPVQCILLNSISNAAQTAKHDVVDWTCSWGWLNLPLGLSMEHEIYKASISLRSYCQISRLNPEKSVPAAVLKRAKGLAILTVAKAGVFLTYKLGTGLVVARRPDGSWSAPSAIISVGLGWGAQIGGELTDFILVLHGSKAVKAFTSRMHLSLGAGLSAAAGPVGRILEADLRAGDGGSGMCYTYSFSKGAFLGVSLEGNIVATRTDANAQFYGDAYLTAYEILLGAVERPRAAAPLYSALDDLKSLRC
uniref:SH3 domain-containing protein PJ696.02 n=1 Tax=Anthurium amnicola TaxID=1678845 RepID=A0A1D1ZL61_9ARAE